MPVLFGAEFSEEKFLLRREVIKWLMTLDLSHSVQQNVRHDLSNGYIVAEICQRYYPADISMHSFSNGTSTKTKQDNWGMLQRFFIKRKWGAHVPADLVDATIKEMVGAALKLIEIMYTLLTGRELPPLPTGNETGEEEEEKALSETAAGPPQSKQMGKLDASRSVNPFGEASVTQMDSQDAAKKRVGSMK